MSRSKYLLLTIAALLCFDGAAPVLAAEATQSGADEGLQEVIVTARRSPERLQEAPLAVTVIGGEQIQAQNIDDTRDLTRVAPMLTFGQGVVSHQDDFVIRGVGTFVNSEGFDDSVGVAFDGVPMARPAGSIANLVDIERVEVLEGPQGMLFGKNASAGLINVITNKPTLNDDSGFARVSYGSYNELRVSSAANLSISDTTAFRVTGWHFGHDGYVDSPDRKIGTENSGGGRLQLLWEPDSKLHVNFTVEATTQNEDPFVSTVRLFNNNNYGVQAWETSLGIVASPGNTSTSSTYPLNDSGHTSAFTADVQYDLGGPVLNSVTSYRKVFDDNNFDLAAISAPGYTSYQTDTVSYDQYSEELRISSPSGTRLNYVVGAIFFGTELNDAYLQDLTGTVPTPVSVLAYEALRTQHYGVFGELTYAVTPALRVIVGGRASTDLMTGEFNRVYATPPVTVIPGFNSPASAFGPYQAASSVRDWEPSYRFGLEWQLATDVMTYATVSRGYKAAGLDFAFTVTPVTFDPHYAQVKPEISQNYEAGIRTQFFDRRLTLNATVFNEIFTNFQTSVRLPTITGSFFSLQNAPQLRSSGGELHADAWVTKEFQLSANVAYANARYTDYTNASCAPAGQGLRPCINGVQSLDGFPLQNSPKLRTNLVARYENSGFSDRFRVFAQAAEQYQSFEYFNGVAGIYEHQGAYGLTDVNAGFGPKNRRWELSVYGNNVFDRHFVTRVLSMNAGSYYTNVVPYEAFARYGIAMEANF